MHVLTKVFVVFVTILSVVLVAMIVPFVANQQNWKEKFSEEHAQRIVADTKARTVQAEDSAIESEYSRQLALAKDEASDVKDQLDARQRQVDDLTIQLGKVTSDKARLEAELGKFSASIDQMANMLNAQRDELKTRRDEAVSSSTRMIQQADRINELFSQVEMLSRQNRRLQEELIASSEQVDNYKALVARYKIDTSEKAANEPFESENLIEGQITRVQSIGGDTFVQVNVGKNDTVAPRMRFLVHRGDQFLGTLVIEEVDQNSAAGRIVLKVGDIVSGDNVQTGGQF